MCKGIGMPGNSTTGRGKIGSSRTPRTLSIASLIKISRLSNLGLLNVIIAEPPADVSQLPSWWRQKLRCDNLKSIRIDKVLEELMTDLAERQCVPCRGGVPALAGAEIQPLAAQVPE